MQFRIRALGPTQQLSTLVIDALDEADARQIALQQHFVPLSVSTQRSSVLRFGVRRASFSLLLFAQELHALTAAGLSVIETLDALIEKESSVDTRTIMSRLAKSLREGLRLSTALQQQRSIFPPLFVGIVQAAEGTSDLPRSLQRYIEYETRLGAIKHKIVSAAIYPAILLVVGGAVTLFLMGYVVPRFSTVYQNTGRTLPWASQLLLSWGHFAGTHALALIVAFTSVVGGILFWAREQTRRGGWWQILSIIPGARQRLEIFELSRLYLTLGILLEGGIPLQQALRLAESVVSSARQKSIHAVCFAIGNGERLSDAFTANRLITPVALRLLRAGEKSGQLGAMLTRAANFYDSESTRWIERFTKTFEPALMAGIGLVIGLIVILLYMPIFDLAGSIQ